MKLLLPFLLFVTISFGEQYKGVGAYPTNAEEISEFRFEVSFDQNSNPTKKIDSPSDLGAILAIGQIKLSFDGNGMINFTFPFYVTQFPDSEHSLVGFYIDHGYPCVLKVDKWSEDSNFTLYEPFRSPNHALTGTLKNE